MFSFDTGVQLASYHPYEEGLFVAAAGTNLCLIDLEANRSIFSSDEIHPDVVQSYHWCPEGQIIATNCKDRKMRILDRRLKAYRQLCALSHESIKDVRVVWMGSNDIISSGMYCLCIIIHHFFSLSNL